MSSVNTNGISENTYLVEIIAKRILGSKLISEMLSELETLSGLRKLLLLGLINCLT